MKYFRRRVEYVTKSMREVWRAKKDFLSRNIGKHRDIFKPLKYSKLHKVNASCIAEASSCH